LAGRFFILVVPLFLGEIVLNTNKLYKSSKQGDIIYNTKYISGQEVAEFDEMCKNIHENVNEPHKLYRMIKHCERVRSNGPWKSLGYTTGDILKPRRDLLREAVKTGWKIDVIYERQGKGKKRGTLVKYTLVHPSGLVNDIVLDCRYDNKDQFHFYKEMLLDKNRKIVADLCYT
jgi:hypothetical protein